MRAGLSLVICIAVLVLGFSLPAKRTALPDPGDGVARWFRQSATALQDSLDALYASVRAMEGGDSGAVRRARGSLLGCRLAYKRLGFVLESFFPGAARTFNGPDRVEVEAPFTEYERPTGFQPIESLLFAPGPPDTVSLLAQLDLLRSSARDLPALLYRFSPDTAQVLQAARLEIIRVLTLYPTGYDAPLLQSGLEESVVALSSLRIVVAPCISPSDPAGMDLLRALDLAVDRVSRPVSFASFDRFGFLRSSGIPLLLAMDRFSKEHGFPMPASPFDIYLNKIPAVRSSPERSRAAWGLVLFYDRSLSGNGRRACADCHQPARFYTDGLARNTASDGRSMLARNTPGLLYARFQHVFFWDGRAATLNDQIDDVIRNRQEMASSRKQVEKVVNRSVLHRSWYRRAFPDSAGKRIGFDVIAAALAGYLETLGNFQSAFDAALAGRGRLPPDAVAGFNLFMGKAQCGTCHFLPVFNGAIPPAFDRDEFEILGVPGEKSFLRPRQDGDPGRYRLDHVAFDRGAFKVPTVRNVQYTAPYFHNGVYPDLASVLEFYNRGGGAGFGFPASVQTLPVKPLGLTPREKREIIAFMKSLSDTH